MFSKVIRLGKLLLFSFLTISLTYGLYLSFSNSYNSQGIKFIEEKPVQNDLFKKYAYISGEVANPGVYSFEGEKRVIDIVSLAGGFTEGSDTNYIAQQLNLSEIVEDQQMIFIPSHLESFATKTSENNFKSGLISINSASASELEELPGIGTSTSEKIISNRPYESIEDLKNVPGIGDSKFNTIKDLISL